MKIREARQEDFLEIHRFTDRCKVLETYPKHLYRIILRYFGNCSFIARENRRITGFVMGLIPASRSDTYFLWQIGIDPGMQGRGLGTELLGEVEEKLKDLGCKKVELTVDPENTASLKLFEKSGYENISNRESPVVKAGGRGAIKDFYGQGRHFILLSKTLSSPPRE